MTEELDHRDSEAQALLEIMAGLSEAHFATAWVPDHEWSLWAIVFEHAARLYGGYEISDGVVQEIALRAKEADAWWIWHTDGPIRVPLEDARVLYETQKARVESMAHEELLARLARACATHLPLADVAFLARVVLGAPSAWAVLMSAYVGTRLTEKEFAALALRLAKQIDARGMPDKPD